MLPSVHELRDMRHDCFRLKKGAECYLVFTSCMTRDMIASGLKKKSNVTLIFD